MVNCFDQDRLIILCDSWSVYDVVVTVVAFVLSINNLESHGMFLTGFFRRIFENLEVQIVNQLVQFYNY